MKNILATLLTVVSVSYLPGLAQVNSREFIVSTSDIDHFWKAYDRLMSLKDSTSKIEVLKQLYFEPASKGLREFIIQRNFTPEKLLSALRTDPLFWDKIRNATQNLENRISTLDEVYQEYARKYGDFYSPDVCFFIGYRMTNATISNDMNWLLFGTELIVRDSSAAFLENFKFLIAHEATHIQQIKHHGYRGELLPKLLMEGGAEFIAELITGIPPNEPELFRYGDEHEEQLWNEIMLNQDTPDHDEWFGSSERGDRPQRLGYYLGYQICSYYYDQATDKRKAFRDIIEIDDAVEFISRSGYAQKFR